jgi:hypothetical protein
MKRFLLVLVAALVLAPAALAKGPSQATITGPGLDRPLSITGNGESEGTALGYLTEYAGFFPATFGQSPDPMLSARPAGKLGPRYRIHYVVPGGEGTSYRLVQDLYPYARGGPVTFMKAGQRIFDLDRSQGGWYRTDPALKRLLVSSGLPRTAPSSSLGSAARSNVDAGSSGSTVALILGLGALLAILLAGSVALFARRRMVAAR